MGIKLNYDFDGNILGFYPDTINYTSIPEPYIEIDEATWQDCIQNPGLRKVAITTQEIIEYVPFVSVEDQLDALDVKYNPQFDALTLAWATASMEGDTETTAARKADKDALKAEYEQKRGVIISGD